MRTQQLCRGLVALALLGLATAGSAQGSDDEARAKKIIGASCFLCHGAEGESASAIYPPLAGQNAEYIAKQLENFKNGQRKSTAMAPMVRAIRPSSTCHALGRANNGANQRGPNPNDANHNRLAMLAPAKGPDGGNGRFQAAPPFPRAK